jgi:NAD(P)-dependent dehydrogenase (short-subunit alcohol dehydrogenase family)
MFDTNFLMLPNHTFNEKGVIITGGGTGLGRSIALGLAMKGAKVMICSRKEDVLKKAADEINSLIGKECVYYSVCDIREWLQVDELITKSQEVLGKIDIFINNAAGNFISPTERLSPKAFDIIVDIVLKGSYNCTLAIGKHWIKEKTAGTILNVVTTYAETGSGYVVPSACAKAGVVALTRSLAVEWGKYNIRLVGVAPGPFPTEGAWSRLLPGNVGDILDFKKKNPLNRLGKHEELVNLASYLVSDYAGFINGEIVTIDGGEWLKGAGEFNMLDNIPADMWDSILKMIRNK